MVLTAGDRTPSLMEQRARMFGSSGVCMAESRQLVKMPASMAYSAEHGMLGEGDAFDGGAFLGVDGLAGGDGVGDTGIDLGAVLDADDGEGVGVEGVLAGVLGGAGFAFGGAARHSRVGSGGSWALAAVSGAAVGGGCHRSRSSMAVGRWAGGGR